jgi:hypothetical protein
MMHIDLISSVKHRENTSYPPPIHGNYPPQSLSDSYFLYRHELFAKSFPAGISRTKRSGSFSSCRKLVAVIAAVVVASLVETVPAAEQKPTIPIIVKDTTTFFWQIVLAGARKAGRELNVTVPELGAQSESDINGQISILENAVSGKPAAIVIAPTQFKALGQPTPSAPTWRRPAFPGF